MSHMWDRGVLNKSSWHGLEEVGTLEGATGAIVHGERTGAWPIALRSEDLKTTSGLLAPGSALVAEYEAHPARVVGCNGARYRATSPAEWRDLVTAAEWSHRTTSSSTSGRRRSDLHANRPR